GAPRLLRPVVAADRDAAAAAPRLDDRHLGLRDPARAPRRRPGGVLLLAVPLPRSPRVPVPRARHADAPAGGARRGPVPPVPRLRRRVHWPRSSRRAPP